MTDAARGHSAATLYEASPDGLACDPALRSVWPGARAARPAFTVQGIGGDKEDGVSSGSRPTSEQLNLRVDGVSLKVATVRRDGELAPIVFLHGAHSSLTTHRDAGRPPARTCRKYRYRSWSRPPRRSCNTRESGASTSSGIPWVA